MTKNLGQSGMKVDERCEVPFPRMKSAKFKQLAIMVKTELRETHPEDYPVSTMI